MPSRLRLALVLSVGLVCVSSGSILVRMAQEAPSLAIAFYRLASATVLLGPLYGWRIRTSQAKAPRQWTLLAASGVALALHFAFWITSLRYTSVAVSVLLVNTTPIPVALISHLWLRERLRWPGWLGVAATLAGSALLVRNDLTALGDWRGAALALAGGLALAAYILIGRRARAASGLVEYVFPVYAIAAIVLLATAWSGGAALWGFSPRTCLFLFALGAIPQTLGHTSYNWALGYLPATVVATLVLAEPILATLGAYWILDESLSGTVALAGAVVAVGISLVVRNAAAKTRGA